MTRYDKLCQFMSEIYLTKAFGSTPAVEDTQILQGIVDSLPRKEFENYDRDIRKVGFEVPDHDTIDEDYLKRVFE